MAVSVERAALITRATTFDIFNASSQSQRRKLMEEFWNSSMILYAPDGSAAQGYGAVGFPLDT